MKSVARHPATTGAGQARPTDNRPAALTRLKLALLDEYKCEQTGYDPYDTSRSQTRDVWSGKRKRA